MNSVLPKRCSELLALEWGDRSASLSCSDADLSRGGQDQIVGGEPQCLHLVLAGELMRLAFQLLEPPGDSD